jgi:hypothetical protein
MPISMGIKGDVSLAKFVDITKTNTFDWLKRSGDHSEYSGKGPRNV